jgi:ribose transport system ATP-binding protein
MAEKALLKAEGISKQFPGVQALENVDFDLRAGEVHVLLGENGAGKSTLMKILAGAYWPDSGKMYLNDKEVIFHNPRQAQEAGIAIIYQEFNLVPYMNVAQNIFLGRFPKKNGFLLDHKKMHTDAGKLLKSLYLELDTNANTINLGTGQQQMVEVAKALSMQSRVLIMDEPTASLTETEIEHLFKIIRELKKQGIGVIYISHRLQEVHEIGDRVTVLRDGKFIGTKNVKDVRVSDLVKMMVGRNIENMFERTYQAPGEEALRVVEIKSGKRLRGASMNLHTCEIVGLAGLVGSGRTELARAIFGVDPIDSGRIFVFGKEVHPTSPSQMVQAGVSLLPEDRKNHGLCLILPMSDNVVMASLKKLFPKFLVSSRKEKSVVVDYIKDLRIATPTPSRITQFLSGGTQQKVVLAKWLCTKARIFIFDEPTRGIDVGAKAEIHAFMNELVKNGGAVLMISSELPEVLGMSDRIFVMREGRVIKEFSRQEATQEKIIEYAMGGDTAKRNPSPVIRKGVAHA